MVVLSTGTAASPGQTNPSHQAFQPGIDAGTQSSVPADWLAANAGSPPNAPGCPTPSGGGTAHDPVMLNLRIRVPTNARSLSFAANFFAADYPEYVCSSFTDFFVALLDSRFTGGPANPADKNIAIYSAPGVGIYPVGVNLAYGDTGLFTQCVNGNVGCSGTSGVMTTCTGTSGIGGTSLDVPAPFVCDANSLAGGATGWLVVRGNVTPGEIIDLRLAVWDTGDHFSDSLVLLDDFRWSTRSVTAGTSLN